MVRAVLILFLCLGIAALILPAATLNSKVTARTAKNRIDAMVGSDTYPVSEIERQCRLDNCTYTFTAPRKTIEQMVAFKKLRTISRLPFGKYEGQDEDFSILLTYQLHLQHAELTLQKKP